ncbi:MAG: tetratricopeptide repeat protein [Myxococcota bacterium]
MQHSRVWVALLTAASSASGILARTLPLVFVLALGACRTSGGDANAAGEGAHAAAGHGTPAARPVELLPGMGDVHHPITTDTELAQAFFDQGLALLYGFNHDEAARSFRRAAELDPDAAMPWWGLALAIGPNYNDTEVDAERARATHDAVQKALARAPRASAREQEYVRAVAKRYASPDPESDWLAFHHDYSDAMRELVHRNPDDLDAATLFAESLMMLRPWQLWTADGEPAPGTLELVAVLESVLRRDPDHPGANHFYIHAVEASKNLERAIPSAERLTKLAPGAGHLVHMPGHIFLQTGDYDVAAQTNVAAAEADRRFVERTGASGMYPLMYWTHNLHFVAYARMQQGRWDEAIAAAREMVRNVERGVSEMQMLEGFVTYPLSVMLVFRKHDAILAEPAPDPAWKLAVAFHHYARGVAHAARGELDRAEAERERFAAVAAALPPESRFLVNNSAADFLAVARAVLDAELAAARGERERVPALWRVAAERQAALQYDEPPPWYEPVAGREAGALLRAGRYDEAEGLFRRALDAKPRDGRLLFGLWQSLLAQERATDATLVERPFRAAWDSSSEPLRLDDL